MHTATNHDAPPISEDLLWLLVDEHVRATRPALRRLWDYYRNELDFGSGDDKRPYRAAQQQGLPRRLTNAPASGPGITSISTAGSSGGGGRREVVIENDIAWRVHTLADFMFGKPVAIQSLADDPRRAELIERVLHAAIDANGGVCLFQDMALLGSVYGSADLLLRADQLPDDHDHSPASERSGASAPSTSGVGASGVGTGMGMRDAPPASKHDDEERAIRHASMLNIETVEAPRAIPIPAPADCRRLHGYILHYTHQLNEAAPARSTFLSRLLDRARPADPSLSRGRRATRQVTELWTADRLVVHHDGRRVGEAANPLGRIPLVHIQNLPQPFFYEGLSEVEPLIPLQDELNTRLSDRANRVTLQSFKMYLGRGIESFTERPIGPGQMWMTDNPDASIEAFGGDGHNPSEEAHINEVREAMDKASGVTAVAAGLLRNKVGNLTSENALRVTLMGLLSRTEKKRISYGKGIERLAELILHALHVTGALRTTAAERRIRLHWPSPVPEDQTRRLRDAALKLDIGVPREQVLAELGY